MSVKKISIKLFIFLIFCPAFLSIITGVMGGIGWYVITSLGVLLFLLSDENLKKLKIYPMLLWFLIWCILYIILLQFFSGHIYNIFHEYDQKNIIYSLIQNIFVVIISLGISLNNKYDKHINVYFLIIIFVNFIFTMIALQTNANISKITATGNTSGYNAFGVVGYGYIYAIIFLLPIILAFIIETKKKYKFILILFLLFIIYFIFKTGYFTANIIMILMFLVFLFLTLDIRVKFTMTIPIFIIGSLLFDPNFIINILFKISESINVFSISERIYQLAYFFKTGDKGDTLARFELYEGAINSFVQHPIVGNAILEDSYKISGHADSLDILAHGGLILFIPFLVFVYFMFKNSIKYTKTNIQKKAVVTIYIFYILLNCINTTFSAVAILAVLIGIIPVYLRIGNKVIEKRKK